MEILVGIQHNFIMPCGIMLKSLLINNESDEINCHAIINKDVTEDDKKSLEKIFENDKKHQIYFYVFKSISIENYPGLIGTHFGESTYYRLFCSSILNQNIHKVLYLDSDMIINGSIKDLWDIDLGNNSVAGVINPLTKRLAKRITKYLDKEEDVYINGGVQLINLDFWRNNNVEKKYVDFIKKDSQWIKFVDQDVLNVVLRGTIISLPITYNLQHQFLYKDKYLKSILKGKFEEIHEARLNPRIIHFTGPIKPWMIECENPYRPLFWGYQKKTEWSESGFKNNKKRFSTIKVVKLVAAYLLHVFNIRISISFYFDKKVCDNIYCKLKKEYENSYNR